MVTVIKREAFTDAELERIENTINSSRMYMCNLSGEYLRRRDLAILKLATFSGLRPGEVLSLKWSDLLWEEKRILISPYTNKERQPQPAPFCSKAEEIMKQYKSFFIRLFNSEWCFPSLYTLEPITTSAWAKRVLQILKESGLYRILYYTKIGQPISNKTPYSCRKTFGTKVYHFSHDPYLTMRALRQKTLRSTQDYVQQSEEEISYEIDKAFIMQKNLVP